MTDLSTTIDPKSDQLNADDLIAGPRTITVTRVAGNNNKDQPVSIFFEGDNGKPFRPCKSMRRVLVQTWGKDGNTYAGKSMTLYRDPEVTFGGIKVGGIRISHVSHIEADVVLMLTESRAKRGPYPVKKLTQVTESSNPDSAKVVVESIRARIAAASSLDELQKLVPGFEDIKKRRVVTPKDYRELRSEYGAKQKELSATADSYDDEYDDEPSSTEAAE